MKRRRRTNQNGFTLIELMIVIAIILVLMALTIPLVGHFTNQARRAATKTTIKKAHEMLQSRIETFEREYKKYCRRHHHYVFDPSNVNHILQKKSDFAGTFPTLLKGPAPTIPVTAGPSPTPADNAEALYFMLTKMGSFSNAAEDTGNFLQGELADTDGDDVLELVDGWGEPIRFYRWPTQLVKNNNAARILIKNLPSATNRDGDDPFGKLTTLNRNTYHDISTMHPPLIVSGGSDKKTGLYEPYDTANLGHLGAPNGNSNDLDDNITNLNNQAGDD